MTQSSTLHQWLLPQQFMLHSGPYTGSLIGAKLGTLHRLFKGTAKVDCVWLVEKLHKTPWKHKLKVIHGMYSVPTIDRVSLLLPVGSG
ncbi:hypothetical protein NC651_033435 [Populus alba x Populus x berolinensis]|nr:hypothetical protein NC651_033435 [Populus alba x Populus x berolinensis]